MTIQTIIISVKKLTLNSCFKNIYLGFSKVFNTYGQTC